MRFPSFPSIPRIIILFALFLCLLQFFPLIMRKNKLEVCEETFTARVAKSIQPEFNELKDQVSSIKETLDLKKEDDNKKIPLLIITYNRYKELENLLKKIFELIPTDKFSVFLSQDGDDERVFRVITTFGTKITKHFQKEHVAEFPPEKLPNEKEGYFHLSQHYKFALDSVFDFDPSFDRVVILEEDLDISDDFFSYFYNLSPLLDADNSLFCITAFNDNGMRGFVREPKQLYRTDFFPGLGWMLKKTEWLIWRRDWPLAYWDEYVRKPKQRLGRSCIRPEISRTYHKCTKDGVSKCQFDKFLTNGQLNLVPIDWSLVDLEVIGNKEKYDIYFKTRVKRSEVVSVQDVKKDNSPYDYQMKDYRIEYSSLEEFKDIAKSMGVMSDEKAGVPRMAYLGIVAIHWRGNTIFISPTEENLLYNNEEEELDLV